jgi:hypothetical protein
MGIGGAMLYSLAFISVRALVRGGALALRWLGRRAFLNGAALHGASVAAVQLFAEPLSGRLQESSTQRPKHDGATGD